MLWGLFTHPRATAPMPITVAETESSGSSSLSFSNAPPVRHTPMALRCGGCVCSHDYLRPPALIYKITPTPSASPTTAVDTAGATAAAVVADATITVPRPPVVVPPLPPLLLPLPPCVGSCPSLPAASSNVRFTPPGLRPEKILILAPGRLSTSEIMSRTCSAGRRCHA